MSEILLRKTTAGKDERQFRRAHLVKNFCRLTLGWSYHRLGDIHFVRRNGQLFLKTSLIGEERHVPGWAFAVLSVAEQEPDFKKPLYVIEPGRKRARKATQGETEYALTYWLRRQGKSYEEIAYVLTRFSGPVTAAEVEKRCKHIAEFCRDAENQRLNAVNPAATKEVPAENLKGLTVSKEA